MQRWHYTWVWTDFFERLGTCSESNGGHTDLPQQPAVAIQHSHNIICKWPCLIATSSEELQNMLGIVLSYEQQWTYSLHPNTCCLGVYSELGLGLLFPKYYLIFHSEFPKLLLYYSLRVDPLFHEFLSTVSQKWPKQTHQTYTCYTNPTKISIKDFNLSKLSVDSVVDPVAEWVDTGHSETESESTELYSQNYSYFPVLPVIPEIIWEQ